MSYIRNLQRNLRYGVIYVVTSILDYDYDRSVARVITPKLLHLLEALTGYKVEVVKSPEVKVTTLMARRINVGNAGKDAVVQMPINHGSISDITRFADSVTDVLSTEVGDKELKNETTIKILNDCHDDYFEAYFEDPCKPKESGVSASKKKKSLLGWLTSKKRECYCYRPAEKGLEIEDEEDEIISIEREREMALKAIQAQILDYVIKFNADPSQLINILLEGQIVIGQKDQLSPLVVNNDLKIVLTNYNEVEVKMPAMCRTIYILFLLHPEGFALRDIADHRADLENIYSMVMPGRAEELGQAAINNLLDPMSNTLNEYISKIKRCFKSCIIDEKLANQYCITGQRGEPYKINIAPELITLPRAVTRN